MDKIRTRLAGIVSINDGFAFMHRTNVKNHPIGNYYTFPGGGMEGNETLEEGTKREIKEEFGIDVEIKELIYKIENEDKNEYFFLCEYISGEFGTGDGPEFNNDPNYIHRGQYIPEIIKIEDLENIVLLPGDIAKQFIADVKNGRFDRILNK